MKKNKKIFLIWLMLVIMWNFGVPEASPGSDVLIAAALSFLVKIMEKNV